MQRDLVMGLHPIRHWRRCVGYPIIFLLLIRIQCELRHDRHPLHLHLLTQNPVTTWRPVRPG